MATEDWSAFEDRLERRLRQSRGKRQQQSGKSVFMLKRLMSRPKTAAKPRKRSGR